MRFKLSKADVKIMIEQSKEMIKIGEMQIKLAKEATRKANINMVNAKAVIKYLGGK